MGQYEDLQKFFHFINSESQNPIGVYIVMKGMTSEYDWIIVSKEILAILDTGVIVRSLSNPEDISITFIAYESIERVRILYIGSQNRTEDGKQIKEYFK